MLKTIFEFHRAGGGVCGLCKRMTSDNQYDVTLYINSNKQLTERETFFIKDDRNLLKIEFTIFTSTNIMYDNNNSHITTVSPECSRLGSHQHH